MLCFLHSNGAITHRPFGFITEISKNKNKKDRQRSNRSNGNMFNFIKKGVSAGERDREKNDRDKERRKKDKKSRKDVKTNIAGNMSSEELLRLDEVSVRSKK